LILTIEHFQVKLIYQADFFYSLIRPDDSARSLEGFVDILYFLSLGMLFMKGRVTSYRSDTEVGKYGLFPVRVRVFRRPLI
jgi:hypothetical protein